MLATVSTTLIPVAAVLLLGFLAGCMKAFSKADRALLTRLVLVWLLPALLLSGVLKTPREDLLNYQIPLIFSLGMVLPFLLVLLFFRFFKRRDLRQSVLKAGLMSNPDLVFMGIPIMTGLLGPTSIFPILVANFLLALILIPLTSVLLTVGSSDESQQGSGVWARAVMKSLWEPRVWMPALGAVLVLSNLHMPSVFIDSLDRIGEATTGISLFVVGLIISEEKVKLTSSIGWNVGLKNIVQPAVMYLIVLTLGVEGSLAREAIILMALPSGVSIAMFAEEFDTLVAECSTSVLMTRLVVFGTIPLLIAATAHMK